jgi:hypothetical protein
MKESKKVVAPLWCVDVHSSDYTRLAFKDLQLQTYAARVFATAKSKGSKGVGGGSSSSLTSSNATSTTKTRGGKGGKRKVKAHYSEGHGSWVEVDRRFDGVQVKVLATGYAPMSMQTAESKKALQQSFATCVFPRKQHANASSSSSSAPSVNTLCSPKGVGVGQEGQTKDKSSEVGFRFRFCGRSLQYPLASAGCLKKEGSGVSYAAFSEDAWLSRSSMGSAAANFVLRDLSLLFHAHAPRKNPALIFAKKLEEFQSESGVWGAKAMAGTKTGGQNHLEEIRGMKGVGVLSRSPTFSRPLLGVRFSVSGRLNGKDMASTVWASGGRLPRSWVSPKSSELVSVDKLALVSPSGVSVAKPLLGEHRVLTNRGGKQESSFVRTDLPNTRSSLKELARTRSGGGLSYAAGTVATRYGSLGLKVWLFF